MLPGAIATKQEDANSHKPRKQIGENAMLEAQEQLNRQHTLRSDPQRGAVLFVLRSADCAYDQWRREKWSTAQGHSPPLSPSTFAMGVEVKEGNDFL